MSYASEKSSRGRPKTLDRDRILNIAMQSYWAEGMEGTSVNEICRRANVSKPGLYREFGNGDGLMKAALVLYIDQVLTPMHQLIESDSPFREVLDKIIHFSTVGSNPNAPAGCLFVNMRESSFLFGTETTKQIEAIKAKTHMLYENWVKRSKDRGELTSDIPAGFAAVYIDTQLGNAMALLGRGRDPEVVKNILSTALSVLV